MASNSSNRSKRRWPLIIIRFAIIVLCALSLFYSWFYYFQFSILIAPNEPTTDTAKTEQELNQLRPPGSTYTLLPQDHDETKSSLHCVLYQAYPQGDKPANGVIAYLHGNRGNQYECRFQIDIFLAAGYDVAVLDYRGFGESEGPITEKNLLSDALLWYDDLQKKGYKEQDIVIWGRSFGTGMAAYIASQRMPRKLVLETPYYSFIDTMRDKSDLAWFIPNALFRLKFPIHEFLLDAETEVHLIHGQEDEKISYSSSVRLKELRESRGQPVKLWPIPGDNHNLRESTADTKPEFTEALNQILAPQ
jgi:pimeloyl-ACP methyl ester carboxylesterase